MEKFFNNAGPNNPEDHYTLDPLARLDADAILPLIEQKRYFVLHAPRQTGKTSCLLALMKHLNAAGKFHCVYANIEAAQTCRNDVSRGIHTIVAAIADQAKFHTGDPTLERIRKESALEPLDYAIESTLKKWCEQSAKPIVLILDEVDALVGDTLISLLRQLRGGYAQRPTGFPQSVILCGVRDVRDYRIHSGSGEIITGGSAFNIKAESLRLGDFTKDDIAALYGQHTAATGQIFEQSAIDLAWVLTKGQPWLVNALAYEVTYRMKEFRVRSLPIAADAFERAKETLILGRDTHIDQLADKLREPRVRRLLEPVLVGGSMEEVPDDDIQYCVDLGLVRRIRPTGIEIANAIYREVIPRQLTNVTQMNLEPIQQTDWYLTPGGLLDMEKLLDAFQQFFRENSESWVERFDYKEAGPQLLLQAFLQRIVNGGGRVEREFGLGRGRVDILVRWNGAERGAGNVSGAQISVIELKLLHKSLDATLKLGAAQTAEYADSCGADMACLLVFDRRPKRPWCKRIFRRVVSHANRGIRVWGM